MHASVTAIINYLRENSFEAQRGKEFLRGNDKRGKIDVERSIRLGLIAD